MSYRPSTRLLFHFQQRSGGRCVAHYTPGISSVLAVSDVFSTLFSVVECRTCTRRYRGRDRARGTLTAASIPRFLKTPTFILFDVITHSKKSTYTSLEKCIKVVDKYWWIQCQKQGQFRYLAKSFSSLNNRGLAEGILIFEVESLSSVYSTLPSAFSDVVAIPYDLSPSGAISKLRSPSTWGSHFKRVSETWRYASAPSWLPPFRSFSRYRRTGCQPLSVAPLE